MNPIGSIFQNLLRIITPEELGELTSKHNGGKFLSLTELVEERLDDIVRDFSSDEAYDQTPSKAKILPFKKPTNTEEVLELSEDENTEVDGEIHHAELKNSEAIEVKEKSTEVVPEYNEKDNLSTFILLEKARLKRSQQTLKQKEIIQMYSQNAAVDIEQVKVEKENLNKSARSGVLVDKKQF